MKKCSPSLSYSSQVQRYEKSYNSIQFFGTVMFSCKVSHNLDAIIYPSARLPLDLFIF